MAILKLIGIGMMILGTAAGFVIFLGSFRHAADESALTFWILFILCFVGGIYLYIAGTNPQSPPRNMLRVAGSILLILGLLSASSIFLATLGTLIGTVQSFGQLWALFVLCTLTGAFIVLLANDF